MAGELNSATIKEYALAAGADVVGIAAASDFGSAPEGHKPVDALPGCRSVIVLGTAVPKEAILSEDRIGFIDVRNATNASVNNAAKSVAKCIKSRKYKA